MSVVEQAKSRLEEIKTKVMAIRGRSSSSGLGLPTLKEMRERGVLASLGTNPGLTNLKMMREKGVLSVLEDKFPRVREVRKGGILGRRYSESKGAVAGEMPEKEISLTVTKAIHGDAI